MTTLTLCRRRSSWRLSATKQGASDIPATARNHRAGKMTSPCRPWREREGRGHRFPPRRRLCKNDLRCRKAIVADDNIAGFDGVNRTCHFRVLLSPVESAADPPPTINAPCRPKTVPKGSCRVACDSRGNRPCGHRSVSHSLATVNDRTSSVAKARRKPQRSDPFWISSDQSHDSKPHRIFHRSTRRSEEVGLRKGSD